MGKRALKLFSRIGPGGVLVVILAAGAVLGACRATTGGRTGPNVIFVTLDTLNIWKTGLFDPRVRTTPSLVALAREGTLFDRVYTTVPITLPSHTTIFSGRPPREHGVLANGDEAPEELETLAEILAAAGYRTAAFVSLAVLSKPFGLDQGFEEYHEPFQNGFPRWYRFADEVLEEVPAWLDRDDGRPFMLWLHLSDPHEPYAIKGSPPDARAMLDDEVLGEWNLTQKQRHRLAFTLPPGRHTVRWESIRVPREDDEEETGLTLELNRFEELLPWLADPAADLATPVPLRPSFALELVNPGSQSEELEVVFSGELLGVPLSEVREQYAAEVAYMDRHLGLLRELLRQRGLDEEAIWVVASDHGEGLYHHGVLGHADYVREDQMRTLWLLKGPGIAADRRISGGPVLTQDILPTVLDLLSLPVPPQARGESRRGCWTDDSCRFASRWPAYSLDTERRLAESGLYAWPYKALRNRWGKDRLFLLTADPREEASLQPGKVPAAGDGLTERIAVQRQAFGRLLERTSGQKLSPLDRTMLESLGYL